jgi:hypothetical protein
MNHLGLEWKYEERAFTFEGYRSKPHVYIMDFEILDGNRAFPKGFYEIKGYMNGQSRQKLRRFRKHYNEEANRTTVVVYSSGRKDDVKFCTDNEFKVMGYNEITKAYGNDVPGWEK